MNDKPKPHVTRLEDIEPRGRNIPVREQLGIHAFGINAFKPDEDGLLINEHDESGSGQEEVYIVLDGKATFEIDGVTVDAPARTFGPSARSRGASRPATDCPRRRDARPGVPGVRLGRGEDTAHESMTAYGEQRYADALHSGSQWPRSDPGPRRPQLQLRVLRDARR